MTTATEQRQSFQLKGSLFTLSVLQLNDCGIAQLREALNEKIKLAPKFFQYAPVVLDLHQLTNSETVDFSALRNLLTEFKLVPVGVRGGNQAMQTLAQMAGFAVMIDPTPQTAKAAPAKKDETSLESTAANVEPEIREKAPEFGSRLITQPIRSGQQVYAQGGDLIVAASVSPGAELLADGNIHVYGTLRGRALAGINGNQNARIFCKGLEAELISIAGQYKVFEEHLHSAGAKQMFLRDGQLIISPL